MLLKIILVTFLVFALNLAIAQTVNVNQTAILVSDTQSNDSLKLKQAFAQILAKNTGENIVDILSSSVFNEANIKKGLKRSYFEKIDFKYLHTHSNKFWFHVVMDENFIQRIILKAGFSLLPHRREPIILWVVKEETELDPIDSSNAIKPSLSYAYNDELSMYWIKRWAKYLGLVLVMPTVDINAMQQVSPRSIKSLSYEANDQSIKHYKTDQSLLLYIKSSLDSVKIRSGLVTKGSSMSIKYFQEHSNETLTVEEGEVLYSVMLEVAERYATINKINQQDLEKHTVRLVVQAMDNYQQVNLVRKYLDSLSMIESYDFVSASKGKIALNVNMTVSTVAFLRIVHRENILAYDNQSPFNQMVFNIVKPQE